MEMTATIFKFNSEEDTVRAALATGANTRGHQMRVTGRRTITVYGEDRLASFREAAERAVGKGNFVEARYD